AWPGVGPELVRMSIGHLQTDIAEQALGSRRKAEEMMEQARIRRTEADLRSVATAIAAFQMDQNAWPPATDMRSLRPLLSPTYIKPMPERDAWGRPFSYRVEGTSYRLASAGPDGVAGNEDDVVVTDQDRAHGGPSRGMPQASSGAMRVGGDVKAPTLIRRVEPVMTDEAVRAKIGGIVILECVIDAQGQVTEARVLKPLPFGLDQAAVDAVRQWQFRPGTLHGQPVPVVFNLTVNFVPKRE
ncbi:MAG TPA: TonB family protein, partial [Thermoanaerobaculia bacterium]